MPRIRRSILQKARAIDSLLPLLLRPCRDIRSATNELRWLREHAQNLRGGGSHHSNYRRSLSRLCQQRSKGVPLQYLLGTQPFGDLEILCKPKVLIPRVDTESYTTHLADFIIRSLNNGNKGFSSAADRLEGLRILDACTGTGCIALLLHQLLAQHLSKVRIQGIDISNHALNLAQKNLYHNTTHGLLDPRAAHEVRFRSANILTDSQLGGEGWDVIVSNPPYISREEFYKATTESVRHFEPNLALIPQFEGSYLCGDVFYEKLMNAGRRARARLLVMEIQDAAQAERVFRTASSLNEAYWRPYAIWHDNVAWTGNVKRQEKLRGTGFVILHEGTGNARAVVLAQNDLQNP